MLRTAGNWLGGWNRRPSGAEFHVIPVTKNSMETRKASWGGESRRWRQRKIVEIFGGVLEAEEERPGDGSGESGARVVSGGKEKSPSASGAGG